MAGNTPLLGLSTPTQGTLSGTWGDTANNATTEYLDIAIAGTQTLSANADATLVQTFGTNLVTNIGATTSQYAIIRWTASNGATTRNINVPNLSKTYMVINDGTGAIVLRGTTGPTAGITIIAGERCVAAWNGSDFIKISSGSSLSGADGAIIINTTVISTNYTIASGTNGFSVGPMTISSGYAITVSSGQRWVVI